MIEAMPLVVQGTDNVQLYACGKCGTCYSPRVYASQSLPTAQKAAQECCDRKCTGCGGAVEKYWTKCEACRSVDDKAREVARFDKAEKVAEKDYGGPVYDERGDQYYSDTDDLRERYEDRDDEEGWAWPTFVYACTVQAFEISADDILEAAGERMEWEDWDDSRVVAVDELQAFVKEWNAKQNGECWHADHSRAIILEPLEVSA